MMSAKRTKRQLEKVCEPLKTYEEMLMFVQDPPVWRSLCVKLKPHSDYAIRNMDIPQKEHSHNFNPKENISEDYNFECPKTFCHFTPEKEKVKRQEIKKLPKTLVCHDMANGYHEDSYIDGSGRYEAYTFYNWAAIDTFCYFSHHLITIPPLGWINVGHAHGVKVLGTVITEWDDGQKFWERVLASEAKWKEFASMLVAIAKTLKFDGWLLNVENKNFLLIRSPYENDLCLLNDLRFTEPYCPDAEPLVQISAPKVLLQFVRFLHASLHQQLPTAQLLWYDSVTTAGVLHWQNGLNELNKDWFDACDGIFTNYSWSAREVAGSAALAGARRADVYVGIDVWGRNFLGGGKFNTKQAVKIAYEHGCSLAIFAPAWTHEAIDEECSNSSTSGALTPEERFQHFLLRERAFWGTLWGYLNTKLPSHLPFRTSFCRGQGLKRRLYGEVLCSQPWYNLRHMQYQPNSQLGPHGYLLTTVPNVLKVSNQGVLKDPNGVLKLRESFNTVQHQETFAESKEKAATDTDDIDQTSTATENTNSMYTKDSVANLLQKIFEEAQNIVDDDNSGPLLSLSVSNLGKKNRLEFVLTPIPGEKECLELYLEDSFIGGSCLLINSPDESPREPRFIRIFQSNFYVEDTLVVCVVTKTLPEFEDQYLNLLIDVETAEGQQMSVVLVGASATDESYGGEVAVYPINETPNADFKEVQKYLLLEEPGFYVPTSNSYDWDVRYYRARLGSGARVTAVSCRAARGRGSLLLGHLGLCNMVMITTATKRGPMVIVSCPPVRLPPEQTES